MNISRATFGRILESARRKIADAILNGKAIKIELVGRVVLDKIQTISEDFNEGMLCS